MNYDLTAEQLSIKANFEKFCKKEIEPRAHMLDTASHEQVNSEIKVNIKMLADLGYLGMGHEEKYGGSNLDLFSQTVAGEEVAAAASEGYDGAAGHRRRTPAPHHADRTSDSGEESARSGFSGSRAARRKDRGDAARAFFRMGFRTLEVDPQPINVDLGSRRARPSRPPTPKELIMKIARPPLSVPAQAMASYWQRLPCFEQASAATCG